MRASYQRVGVTSSSPRRFCDACPSFGHGPAIQCSCPIVAHRLLTTGGDLRPVMLPLLSPPVALARYVRAVSHPTRVRITYVGGCPGAVDESIDIRMSPETLIGMLAEREIVLDEQPRVFESIIPPDRRRYFSQPGGVPSAETAVDRPRLARARRSRVGRFRQRDRRSSSRRRACAHGRRAASRLRVQRRGVRNAGARGASFRRRARAAPLYRSGRRGADAARPRSSDSRRAAHARRRGAVDANAVVAARPADGIDSTKGTARDADRDRAAHSAPALSSCAARRSAGRLPTARHADGKALPRAYVARRRQSAPKGNPVVPPNASADASTNTSSDAPPAASDELPPNEPTPSVPSRDAETAATAAEISAGEGVGAADRPAAPTRTRLPTFQLSRRRPLGVEPVDSAGIPPRLETRRRRPRSLTSISFNSMGSRRQSRSGSRSSRRAPPPRWPTNRLRRRARFRARAVNRES